MKFRNKLKILFSILIVFWCSSLASSDSDTSDNPTFSKVIRRRVPKDGKALDSVDRRLKKVLKRKHHDEGDDDDDDVIAGDLNGNFTGNGTRNGRFFSLFTVVRFKNDPCITSSSGNGTCYNNFECNHRGGISQGACASGFGVCCFFSYMCGRTTGENGTYFNSPPSPQRICNLQVDRLNRNICQIRLEFEQFEINGPNYMGVCDTDFFLATGGSPTPMICGANSGQHIVYTVTPDSGPTQLSVVMDTTVTTTNSARTFRIRVNQLECTHPYLAPNGCLQYYIGASGNIRSFNYKTAVVLDYPNHLANLNYAICFRIENGYCGIKYMQPAADIYSFTLSGDATILTSMTMLPLPPSGVMYSDTICQKDYLVIVGGSQTGFGPVAMFFAKDRYCGLTLGYCGVMGTQATSCTPLAGPVVTYTRPFVVTVMTDPDEGPFGSATDKANRGFNLIYSQQPCIAG